MSTFPGLAAQLPAAYWMRRRITLTTDLTKIEFRGQDWFGSCPQLTATLKTLAMRTGEIKRVDARLYTGTRVELYDSADAPDQSGSANSDLRVVTNLYGNTHGRHEVWAKAGAGGEVVEIEVWFDVPTLDQSPTL